MRNKYTAEMVLTLVDNASKSLKNSQAQVKKLQKLLEDGDKKEGQRSQRRKKRLTEEEAAQKLVNAAIRARNIDKHVASIEKEAIATGKLTGAISKQGKALERADASAAKAEARRSRVKTQLSVEAAARKRISTAMRAEKIELHVRKLEQEALARGRLSKAISKQGIAQDRAAKKTLDALSKSSSATKKQVSLFSKLGSAAQKAFFIYETFVRIASTLKRFLVDPFVDAGKAASDFAGKLAEINTLFDKGVRDSSDRVATLGESIKQLSRDMGLDLTKTAEAAYNAVSSGAVDSATAQSLLHNATKLSVAGLVETDVAMKALTTVSNSFGVSLGNTERVGDLLFTTVQKGVTTMRELGPKIGRVAGVAAASGMNMEAMFSVLAAGTKVTGNTSRAVTGLSSAINLILKPGKEAREMVGAVNDRLKGYKIELGSAGLQGDKMIKNLQSMAKAFKQGKLSADELAKIIPNQRAQAIVLGIVKSGATEVADIYKTMSDRGITAGAMQEALNKIMNTSQHQIKRYKSGLEGAQTALGGFFEKSGFTKGFFKGMADELENVIRAFVVQDEGVEDNAESWENWGRTVVRVVGMVALALKLVVQVVFTVLEAFETLFTTVQTGLMLAFESVFSRLPTYLHKTLVDSVLSAVQTIRDLDFPGADKLRSWLGFDTDFGGGLGPIPFLEGMSASAGAELKHLKLNAETQLKFIEERVNKVGKSINNTFDSIFTGLTVLTAGDLGKVETTLNKSIGLDKKTGGGGGTTPGAGDPFELKGKDEKQAAAFLAETIARRQTAFQEALKTPGGTPEIPTKGIAATVSEFQELFDFIQRGATEAEFSADTLASYFRAVSPTPGTIPEMLELERRIEAITKVISKLGKEDLTKILSGGIEGANKILLEQQKKALEADKIQQDTTAKRAKKRQSDMMKRHKADDKRNKKLTRARVKESNRRLKEIEQTASAIASTVVGLGSTLISDLMDKEKTTEEAFKSLGNSLLEMGATAVAEFLVREGAKQVMIAFTSGMQQTAAAAEIAASNTVTGVVVANQAKQAAAKLAASGAGAVGKAAGGVAGAAADAAGGAAGAAAGGAAGGPWGMIIMAAVAVIGALLSWLMDNDASKHREATKLEGFYLKEAKHYSRGGLVTGGVAGRDSVNAMLTPGEFVLNKPTVDAIRQGKPPATPGRYATGGMVTAGGGSNTQIVFAPRIETIGLPNSVQNMRYFRDTVAKTRGRLAGLKG